MEKTIKKKQLPEKKGNNFIKGMFSGEQTIQLKIS